jgi:hypothetical protein
MADCVYRKGVAGVRCPSFWPSTNPDMIGMGPDLNPWYVKNVCGNGGNYPDPDPKSDGLRCFCAMYLDVYKLCQDVFVTSLLTEPV